MHRTNIELNEKLVKEGMRLFSKKTKKRAGRFCPERSDPAREGKGDIGLRR